MSAGGRRRPGSDPTPALAAPRAGAEPGRVSAARLGEKETFGLRL